MLQSLVASKVKTLSSNELKELCEELRTVIYDTVMKCGGHLASNLGAVESTVALCYCFDFPNDKIVFDVGHQCYAYKLLSGRAERFSTLRQAGGISGFPKRSESEYDSYDTGHAGTSVSAAIGIAKARDLQKKDFEVIAYIGDGSFNNGLVYEALNSLKILNTRILIILNDNGMSISPTVGGMHEILSTLDKEKAEGIKLLEQFGLRYIGVKDGNDLTEMINALSEAKTELKTQSVLLHIATKKGKGYEFSEEHPTDTHGVPPVGGGKQLEYSQVLGETLCRLAEKDKRIAVISAAMKESLGLESFFAQFPERAFDVGICEENACVLCASMATQGIKPYYAIYSTFLQRAFDELIHDVGAMDLPVVFCIDRAGISGADGETHQGVFDLSYLSMIPNLTVLCPKDTEEFKKALEFSVDFAHPLAIRYPRAGRILFDGEEETSLFQRKWEYLHKADKNTSVAVLATGERCLTIAMQVLKNVQAKGKDFHVVNARFVKPLDVNFLRELSCKHILTIEDNVQIGGFGWAVNSAVMQTGKKCTVRNFAYKDEFIVQGSIGDLQRKYGVDGAEMQAYIEGLL